MCRVQNWKDRVDIVPKGKVLRQFVRKKRECRKIRGKRSKHATIPGTSGSFRWMGKAFNNKEWKRRSGHTGGNDLLRKIETHGMMLVWGRLCSGYFRVKLGSKWLNSCCPPFIDDFLCVSTFSASCHYEGQVKVKRMSTPCERRFFFPINFQFMREGSSSGQRFEGRR